LAGAGLLAPGDWKIVAAEKRFWIRRELLFERRQRGRDLRGGERHRRRQTIGAGCRSSATTVVGFTSGETLQKP